METQFSAPFRQVYCIVSVRTLFVVPSVRLLAAIQQYTARHAYKVNYTTMPGGTDTAKYSNNSAGSKISVGPKTTLAVASFDPDGFIALEKGRTMGYVTFQTGVDSNQAKRIKYWATCTEIEKASPRQLMVTLPDGSYKIAIFTTNVTKDGPGFTEKTIKGREVSLTGTLTVGQAYSNTCMVKLTPV